MNLRIGALLRGRIRSLGSHPSGWIVQPRAARLSGMTCDEHHTHRHHAHAPDEREWRAMVDQVELEGEVLLSFVTDTADWVTELRHADAPPLRRILDIGSGPGVGTCELARLFPAAAVTAVDNSPAMLERTTRRAAEHGLADRVSTHLGEVPVGLDGLGSADLIWASMSLHHIGDEVGSLQVIRELVRPHGLLAIAEFGEPMRMLPDAIGFGRPGLFERLDHVGATWLKQMRDGLTGSVVSTDLASMLASAGFDVVDSRLSRQRIDAPLPENARRFALGYLRRARNQFQGLIEDDDLLALDVLTDPDDELSVVHRPDVFVDASRQIVIARPVGGRLS